MSWYTIKGESLTGTVICTYLTHTELSEAATVRVQRSYNTVKWYSLHERNNIYISCTCNRQED